MEIDGPTLRGLEVLTAASGRDGTLLSVMDRTLTAPGARLLVRQLSAPLTDPRTINRRLDMVQRFVDDPNLRADCRDVIGGMPDILRACGRLSLGKAGPLDLAAIGNGISRAGRLAGLLGGSPNLLAGLATAARELAAASAGTCGTLAASLRRALAPDPPPPSLGVSQAATRPAWMRAGPRLPKPRMPWTGCRSAMLGAPGSKPSRSAATRLLELRLTWLQRELG